MTASVNTFAARRVGVVEALAHQERDKFGPVARPGRLASRQKRTFPRHPRAGARLRRVDPRMTKAEKFVATTNLYD